MNPDAARCAAGEAAWHAAAYASLGVEWDDDGELARADGFAHRFLPGAVTLTPDARVGADVPGPVRDSFGVLDVGPGWHAEPADPWLLRPSAPSEVAPPPGVRIERTDDPLRFEHTAFLAAGGEPPQRAGELHPPGSERQPSFTFLLAVRGDVAIGTTLAVTTPHCVHVTAVAVLPAERGRGVGAALTAAAVACAPDRPATLASSAMALTGYERLGFRRVPVTPRQWHRSP